MFLEVNHCPYDVERVHQITAAALTLGSRRLGMWHSNPELGNLRWQDAAELAASILRSRGNTTMRVGPDVTNLAVQTPAELADELLRLDDRYPGQVWVGIGSGDSSLVKSGIAPTSARETVERADMLQARLVAEGRDLPVVVAAHGPKILSELGSSSVRRIILGTGFDEPTLCLVERLLKRDLCQIEVVLNPALVDIDPPSLSD